MLVSWPGGSWQDTVWLVVALLVAYVVVLWLAGAVWVYRDIKSRTNDLVSQSVSVLLVLVFNLPGLVIYLILRPRETLTEAYERGLDAEAMLQELERFDTCPSCQRRIEDRYLLCPYCRTRLRQPCAQCGQALSFGWVACPYCGSERVPTAIPGTTPPTAQSTPSAAVSPAPTRPVRPRTSGVPANTEPLS